MAALSIASNSWLVCLKEKPHRSRTIAKPCGKVPLGRKTEGYFLTISRPITRNRLRFSARDDSESEPSSSSVAVVSDERGGGNDSEKAELPAGEDEVEDREKQQEMDWKTDEEFKKFMGNPSIEAAIKLEKKRADRKLKELDREGADNPIVGLFTRIARDNLAKEKERLEKAEETFKALDLNKVFIFFSPFLDVNILYYIHYILFMNHYEGSCQMPI